MAMRIFLVGAYLISGIGLSLAQDRQAPFTQDQKLAVVRCIYQQMFVQRAEGNTAFNEFAAVSKCGADLRLSLSLPLPPTMSANSDRTLNGPAPGPPKPAISARAKKIAEEREKFLEGEVRQASALFSDVSVRSPAAR